MSQPELHCRRCGKVAYAEWVEVTTLRDEAPVHILGRSWCPTFGCVDENGSSYVPPPDVPGELTYDDQQWVRRHERLVAELGALHRQLMEAM